MNDVREPIRITHRRTGFMWLLGFAVVGLIGSLLGGTVILIDVWRRAQGDATTSAPANVARPPDTAARTTR